jgi:hypothetical protein
MELTKPKAQGKEPPAIRLAAATPETPAPRRRPGPPLKFGPQRQAEFLKAYGETADVELSARAAGVCQRTIYTYAARDPAFAAGFEEAKSRLGQRLEEELFRRALNGTDKAVYQGGQFVGMIRERDTTALIFALKGLMPARYGDRVRQEHTSPDGSMAEARPAVVQAADPGEARELLDMYLALEAKKEEATAAKAAKAAAAPEKASRIPKKAH